MLTDDDLLRLPLADLMALAGAARDEAHGRRVTFSPKVFIPLTMLCRDRCGYCTFAKAPARLASPYLTPDEVLAIARAGREAGCHEALFTLGERPELRYPRGASSGWRPTGTGRRWSISPHVCRAGARGDRACSPTPTPARSSATSWPGCARCRPARG